MGAYEHYLAHHGVKGQKWGHRRYQNEDGTLTAEGRARYAKELETYAKADLAASMEARKNRTKASLHKDSGIIRDTIAGGGGTRALANWRTRRFAENLKYARENGDEKAAAKYESKLKAQSKANADLQAYRNRTSTGKLIAQNYLLSAVGGHRYRKMRARGNGRLTSLLGAVDSTGLIRGISNKRKYGKWVIHDAMKRD